MAPVRRGSDWLDGALAGWLLVVGLQAAGGVLRGEGGAAGVLLGAAAAGLSAGAIVPVLAFHRMGWALASAGLVAHAAWSALHPAASWFPVVLLPHLLALAYALHLRPAAAPAPAAEPVADSALPEAESTPAADPTDALTAVHRLVAEAGSACAVGEGAVRDEAARFGLSPDDLAAEGITLYRTFLAHFLANGELRPVHERELAGLAGLLGIDDGVVAAVRAEAGVERQPAADAGRRAPEAEAPFAAAGFDDVPLAAGERLLDAREVEMYRVSPATGVGAGFSLDPVAPPRSREHLLHAGRCRLLLTDRRLLLVAPSGQQSPLPLERVGGAAAYGNGIEVRPLRGPALFLRFENRVGEFAAKLSRALAPRAYNPDGP